jgi:hypothetical protein
MKRLLAIGCLAWAVTLTGSLPAWGQDSVTYYNRAQKKEATVSGSIMVETPGKIVIRPTSGAAKEIEISVTDIREVVYNLPPVLKNDYRIAANREGGAEKDAKASQRKQHLAEALAKYQDLLAKATAEPAKRHFEFKIAKILAQQAADDPAQVDAALENLKKFKTEHPDAWQISACTDLLARLLMEKKDWEGAQRAYQDLEKTPNLPPELRQEANLKVAQVLVKAKKYPEAEQRLLEASKTIPAAGPERIRLQMALAECQAASGKANEAVKQLEAVLPQITDPEMKAQAYNSLGSCQEAAQRPKDALYAYLWVDVVYSQNRQEHAKAVYHLAKLFKEIKDDKRAEEYRNKLLKSPEFAGLEYQKMLMNETK